MLTNRASAATKKNDPAVCRSYIEAVPGVAALIREVGVDFAYPAAGKVPTFVFRSSPKYPGPGLKKKLLGPNDTETSGSGLIVPMIDAFVEAGGELLQRHKLVELVAGEDGSVVGAIVEAPDGPVAIRATRGVVLGSGGWKGHPSIRRLYDPRMPADLRHTGYPYALNDGSAIEAAFKVGAAFVSDQSNDAQLFRVKFGTPYYNFAADSGIAAPGVEVGGSQADRFIFVNKAGERFIDESIEASSPAHADVLLLQEDHASWAVFDEEGLQQYGWTVEAPICDPAYVFKADTVEGLAEAMGVDAGALVATVEGYNACVEAGVDEAFQKPAEKLTAPIATPPFYALKTELFIHDSCGGLSVNERCEVMGYDGEPLGGLYAGGDAAGPIYTGFVARAVTMGYMAAQALLGEDAQVVSVASVAPQPTVAEEVSDDCLSCHNADDVREQTEGVTVLVDNNGTEVNPHNLPAGRSHAFADDCTACHDGHTIEGTLERAEEQCVSCHHADVFECYTCHE